MCRRCIELAERDNTIDNCVRIHHVDQVFKETFSSPTIVGLSAASLHQKIFISACVLCKRKSGNAEIFFEEVRPCRRCPKFSCQLWLTEITATTATPKPLGTTRFFVNTLSLQTLYSQRRSRRQMNMRSQWSWRIYPKWG
jgi:hypothetical protein